MRKEQTIPVDYESPEIKTVEIVVEQAILSGSILPGLEEDDWV